MVESARNKLDAKFNALNQTRAVNGYSTASMDVPLYTQEDDDWCGPACMKMVIKYVTGRTISQSTLANAADTDSSGTYVYKMKRVLYDYCGTNSYYYYTTTELDMKNATISSMDDDYPVVYHVKTGTLPGYSSSSNYGHYIVGKGYYKEWNVSNVVTGESITYLDPWTSSSANGQHTVTMNAMKTAVNNNAGYYICHVIP